MLVAGFDLNAPALGIGHESRPTGPRRAGRRIVVATVPIDPSKALPGAWVDDFADQGRWLEVGHGGTPFSGASPRTNLRQGRDDHLARRTPRAIRGRV